MRNLRLPLPVLLLALAAPSIAQTPGVEVRMKWGSPPKTCVMRSDADGVSLAADGALQFNGTPAATDCPGSGGGTVTDPQITDGLDATELPSQLLVGASTTVHWSANADSCSYAGSSFPAALANWPTSGAGATPCSSAVGCATDHAAGITFAQAGTYTFKLTCNKVGAANPAVSTRTVTVSEQPSTECIAPQGLSRLTSGTVKYNNGDDRVTNLTLFENVYGHDPEQPNLPGRPFPGTVRLIQRIMMPKNTYVALKFTVPANISSSTNGSFVYDETTQFDRPEAISIRLSRSCGDFTPPPPLPARDPCVINAGALRSTMLWGSVASQTSRCYLQPGQTYYLNILHANLQNPTTTRCTLSACSAPIQSAGNWQ